LSRFSAGAQIGPRFQSLREAFIDRYAELKGRFVAPFTIQFYPFCDLNHSIRIRKGRILVRISDVLANAPQPVLEALLGILLYKLFNKPVPPAYRGTYRDYVGQNRISRMAQLVRSRRGRKSLNDRTGEAFDLRKIFQELNNRHFRGRLQVQYLCWSHRKSRTILGHYDRAHNSIVINQKLDDPRIPKWVVEYVLFHEMLHVCLGIQTRKGRCLVHHSRFREAERRFPDYLRAKAFISTHLC
jgi:hypothetical protein